MTSGINLNNLKVVILSTRVNQVQEYYTAKEAASILGLKYHTLLARAKRGRYPFIKIGWAMLFPKWEVDKHANNGPVEEPKG